MEWKDRKLVRAEIRSTLGGNCRLRTGNLVEVKGTVEKEANGPNPNPYFHIVDAGKPLNKKGIQAGPAPGFKFFTIDFNTQKDKLYVISGR
jgi:alpha-L-fucosidase 2